MPSPKRQPDRTLLGAPFKEWGALAFVVVCGAVLIVKAGTSDGWRTAALGAGGGALLPLAFTLKLWREHRLFLRSSAAVERSRERIDRISVPLGWALGLVLVAFAGTTGVVAVIGGLALGFFPGLLANFLRLRREVWR